MGCPSGSADMMLGSDDFDLNSIPPIQLGAVPNANENSKEGEHLDGAGIDLLMEMSMGIAMDPAGNCSYGVQQQHGPLLGYDDVMANHTF
jgi:hypothetical protein